MTVVALLAALRRMGYQGQHTAHGFRTTASTLLHEQGFYSDMIERQLSHSERNKVKAAYNRAQHLPQNVTQQIDAVIESKDKNVHE
jgi:integrase